MEGRSRRIRPRNGNLDSRLIALGVVGFTVLAASFFLLGLFCIGPILRGELRTTPTNPAPRYSPPETLSRNSSEPSESAEDRLHIEITEHSEEETSPAEEESSPSDSGVQQDENGLTLRLEPQGGDANRPETNEPAKPDPPKPDKPSETLAPPRAATEDKRIFRVQAGTFAEEKNARNLAADLREKGYKVDIRTVQDGDRTLHRVQLGGYRTQEDAEELAKDLSADGYSPAVVNEKQAE